MPDYRLAARLIAQVQRAGARHSVKDSDMIQRVHDMACELGAKCPSTGSGQTGGEIPQGDDVMTVEEMRRYAPNPMLTPKGYEAFKAAVEALVLRHPGHQNQKVHGNRFGGYEATKESLRRLKEDKGAREAYKATARKKTESVRKQFVGDIETQGQINKLGDRQNLLQRQIDTENLKPKYRKEKQAEISKIQSQIDALKVSRVRPGSFIKAKGTSFTGLVRGKGTMKVGKETIPVFNVTGPRGQRTLIPVREAEIIQL